MLKLIDMYVFKGWTRKEKRQFLLSLLMTVAVCAALFYASSLLESVIRPHEIVVYTNQTA